MARSSMRFIVHGQQKVGATIGLSQRRRAQPRPQEMDVHCQREKAW
jgi:hypothetical protein